MTNTLKLINMQDVAVEEIRWLWYPYIPFGKITIIQGDPGDGKTTMILAIASALTKGLALPETKISIPPVNVIYQTAEDGLGDTIKPRLIQAGADLNRVIVIDESVHELSISDIRIEQAIKQINAGLFILDPLQAYIGVNVDMHRANEIRPLFKHLGAVAEKTGCAVVIVGHMNKGGYKSQYRGLGSIDIQAAARSVLTVGRIKGESNIRAFAQGKSNLAPEGAAIAFELNPETGFKWIGEYPITIDELLQGSPVKRESTHEKAEALLRSELDGKPMPASEIIQVAGKCGISERTLNKAKSSLGIKSFKSQNKWFWRLDSK